MTTILKRPPISSINTGKELKRWYWLKEELVAYSRKIGINYSGGKFEILDRMADVLDNKASIAKKSKGITSSFDWSKETLSLQSKITDSYRNGPNVRKIFIVHCGEKFHFSIPFMKWMKDNVGKTLKDAVKEWKRLDKLSKDKNFKSTIPAHNQYNQYIRDFFLDNPDKTIKEARLCWKKKRQLPLERHRYEPSDLKLIGDTDDISSKTKRTNCNTR
jgi:Domain of unknown function (DUF6434)/SAP domain-containing new25